jgi:hypothetical protein
MPTAVPELAFPTGAFVAVDQGALELGIVRDSVLTSPGGFCVPNDYSYFVETFECVAQVRPVREALPAFTAARGLTD